MQFAQERRVCFCLPLILYFLLLGPMYLELAIAYMGPFSEVVAYSGCGRCRHLYLWGEVLLSSMALC